MKSAKYSIGIVTYIKRFENYFQPLVRQLESFFPDVEKNYVLNGFYDQDMQREYLSRAKTFLAGTSMHSVNAYQENQSLSKCWNQLILRSSAEKIIILNDDVSISWPFRWMLEAQLCFYSEAVINKSWSHFLISKDTVRRVGWFDERFPGVGHEDGDYALRLAIARGEKKMPKLYFNNIYCCGLKNYVALNTDPGWSKQSNTEKQKYASANTDFFYKKWRVENTPFKGAIRFADELYVSLNPGMETPNFYSIK